MTNAKIPPPKLSSDRSNECNSLKQEMQVIKAALRSNFPSVIFDIKFVRYASDSRIGYENQEFSPPRIFDGSARAPHLIELPDPCYMAERDLPSADAYSFIFAHEFSHKIIDGEVSLGDQDCYDQYSDSLVFPGDELVDLGAMLDHHSNVDILGLKILSHLGFDSKKIFNEFRDYLYKFPHMAPMYSPTTSFRSRFLVLESIVPTDF